MRKIAIILFSFSIPAGFAQGTDYWKILSDVSFITKNQNNQEIDSPKFGQALQGYHGKKIVLKGYLIPLSEFGGKDEYMLSALPFSTCFFCGGAGPETVVELQVKQSIKFTTAPITVEGILILNDRDPDHHIYIIKDAVYID